MEKIARTARLANADCIEWGADVHVKSVKDALNAKKLCDAYGIGISSYGSYYRVGSENSAEWKKICETAAALDCSSVRVWLGDKTVKRPQKKSMKSLSHPVLTGICLLNIRFFSAGREYRPA